MGQRLESFRWQGLIGAVFALAGVAIVFRDQIKADVPIESVMLLVVAAGAAAQGGIILKRFPPVNLMATNAVAMGLGGLTLLVMSVLKGEAQALPDGLTTWGTSIYLATLGTLGTFMLYMFVYRHWSASAASYQYVVAPIVAVALAALVLEEGVSGGFFVGGSLVLVGVYVGALMPPEVLRALRRAQARQ